MTPAIHDTHDEDGTRHVAAALAATLAAGDVVLLYGDLGAGKTAFVKGLATGLGLAAAQVTSPTFTLVHEYGHGRLPLLHLDLYRLERTELDEVGLDPDLAARGVVVVEWAERLRAAPAPAIHVTIVDRGGDERRITIRRSPID